MVSIVAAVALMASGQGFADTQTCKTSDVHLQKAGNPSTFFVRLCPTEGSASGKVVTDFVIHSDGSITDISVASVEMSPNTFADCASQAAIAFVQDLKVYSDNPACTAQMTVKFQHK
jgi:hypothetical protein